MLYNRMVYASFTTKAGSTENRSIFVQGITEFGQSNNGPLMVNNNKEKINKILRAHILNQAEGS